VVADKLGNLMNKMKVLLALKDKSLPPHLCHIQSFKKDLTTLKLNWNKKYVSQQSSSAASSTAAAAAAEGASD
ncbi:unnamed protein product, partial [Symbiodinium sp. KB8]